MSDRIANSAKPSRTRGIRPLLKAMCVLACGSGLAAGCGTQGLVGQSLEIPEAVWAEMGAADGAVAGSRDGWAWWNRMISEYDGAFARLSARSRPEINPAASYFSAPQAREPSRRAAAPERGDWLPDQLSLAPNGGGGFAESLSVSDLPPGKPMALKRRPAAYHGAFAQAWAASYAAALHEREIALERWVKDRHELYRVEGLVRGSLANDTNAGRLPGKVHPQPRRGNHQREVWILSKGVVSSDKLPERVSKR